MLAAAGVAGVANLGEHLNLLGAAGAVVGLVAMLAGLRQLLPAGTARFASGVPAAIAFRGVLAGVFVGMEVIVPLTLTVQLHYSPTLAGTPLMLAALSWAAASAIQSRLPHPNRAALVGIGLVLMALSGVGMALVALRTVAGAVAFAVWPLAGFGAGFAITSASVVMLECTTDARRGSDSAALQLADSSVSAISAAFAGALVALAVHGRISYGTGFAVVFLVMAGVAVTVLSQASRLTGAAAGRSVSGGRRVRRPRHHRLRTGRRHRSTAVPLGRARRPGSVSSSPMTYLDHAATTPMLPEVIDAVSASMRASATGAAGNPSSVHTSGRQARRIRTAGRRIIEESRERLAAALDARPSEVIFTIGRHRGRQPGRQGHLPGAPGRRPGPPQAAGQRGGAPRGAGLGRLAGEHDGAELVLLPVDADGVVRPEALAAALADDPDAVALVSVMWANNEVGSIQPIAELAEIAHALRRPVPHRRGAGGRHPGVSFADSGVDAMSVTAHKIGGPYGVGALLLGRGVPCVPVLHGGGQERDVRSGTLDTPGAVGFALAAELAVGRRAELASRLTRLRNQLIAGVRQAVPDAVLNGHPAHRLPGNAHLSFPGCEGDSLLMLLDARGIECSTGSACSAGVAQPSHVLLAMGADEQRARGRAAAVAGPQLHRADVRTVIEAIGPVVERARRAGAAVGGGRHRRTRRMRVLAAMSGGVDSAVAAARAVAAGWDVTGVHLALSRQPATLRTGSRGCCSLEDSHDARRTADILGIPFYVWDFAERFPADVIDDFVAEYQAGRTPNPCLRCNEKIKFSALLDRALALGFDAVVTGHHARLADGRLYRSVDAAKDQSYVLAVLTPRAAGARGVPARRLHQGPGAGRGGPAGAGGGHQARLARHLLHRRRRHPGLPGPPAGGAARRHRRHRRRGARQPCRHPRLHRRPAPRAEPDPAERHRRAPLRAVDLAEDQHRGGGRRGRPAGRAGPVRPAGLDRRHRRPVRSSARCSCGRTAWCRRPGSSPSGTGLSGCGRLGAPQRGVAAGQALVMYDGERVLGSATILGTDGVPGRCCVGWPAGAAAGPGQAG